MRFKVFIERKALKELEDMDEKLKDKIVEKLQKLKNGFSLELDIKKLKGYKNHYRLRIGKIRILFKIEEDKIIVHSILPRQKAYR